MFLLVQMFFRIGVWKYSGGRTRLFSIEQEYAIVDMVVQNNTILLKEIQQRIIQDNQRIVYNIPQYILSTTDCVLRRNASDWSRYTKCPLKGTLLEWRSCDYSLFKYAQANYCTFTVKAQRYFFPGFYVSVYYSTLNENILASLCIVLHQNGNSGLLCSFYSREFWS